MTTTDSKPTIEEVFEIGVVTIHYVNDLGIGKRAVVHGGGEWAIEAHVAARDEDDCPAESIYTNLIIPVDDEMMKVVEGVWRWTSGMRSAAGGTLIVNRIVSVVVNDGWGEDPKTFGPNDHDAVMEAVRLHMQRLEESYESEDGFPVTPWGTEVAS